ncbi:MAG: hypothetical protein LWX52_17425, partial [Deltaproteobacteria bacterium]|nr:hypothetical protein [Deltaproteobacteria bacterium]
RISNPIYKKRFTKTFFRESGAIADVSVKGYFRHDGLLNMEVILSDFEEYIVQIGVSAFYKSHMRRQDSFCLPPGCISL